jgi:hypothetical protein
MDIGGCSPAGLVTLGEIYVAVNYQEVDPYSCAPWDVGTASLQSCDGEWLQAGFIPQRAGGSFAYGCICNGWQFCYSLAPHDLYPLNGATEVPLDVVLTWVAPEGWDPQCYVSIGTDPTCATVQYFTVPCDADAFAPNFLQPATTYYWRSSWATDSQWSCGGASAIHSFTTIRESSVQESTWGRIKSMYRR